VIAEIIHTNFEAEVFFSLQDICKHNFSNRIVDIWNKLPGDVVTCTPVNSFENKLENKLDRFMHKRVYISLQKLYCLYQILLNTAKFVIFNQRNI